MNQVSRDRRQLARRFPLCFTNLGSGDRKKPLKHDIHLDIIERGFYDKDGPISYDRLMAALRRYRDGARYANAMSAGGETFDLDGKPCGIVLTADMERYRLKIIRMGWGEQDKQVAA